MLRTFILKNLIIIQYFIQYNVKNQDLVVQEVLQEIRDRDTFPKLLPLFDNKFLPIKKMSSSNTPSKAKFPCKVKLGELN